MQQEFTVDCLMPPNDVDTEVEELHCILMAQEECSIMGEGNDIAVVDDEELGNEAVVEIVGRRANISFTSTSILRYLMLYIKHLDKFFRVKVELVDDSKKYRTLSLGNDRSLATISELEAALPMIFERPGW
eukprot:CAMPEP_0113948556 /NCGR_PEP_ID=MMETSP1339-20121228/70859_1 /TAXON_ID=94617 /ORGANISM="Fibrocapsa japonica" /LENGTH=130 /DNA_ID=CAMNT_0000955653 /DNA_START=29 /DNA_END=418 /DNA_ORIENTATION=- /assembly_acc=CAM_ASM_000762